MSHFKIITVSVLLLLIIPHVYSQNITEDLKRINETYARLKDISMKVEYRVYDHYNSSNPIQVEHGYVVKNNELMINKIGNVEIISSAEYQITVNHDEKVIFLRSSDSSFQITPGMMYDNLEKMSSQFDNIEFVPGSSASEYVISFESAQFKKASIVFNKRTFFIEKITIFYKEGISLNSDENDVKDQPKLEIEYSDIKTNAKINGDLITKYIQKENGTFTLSNEYRAYTLFNQLIN